MAKLYYYYSAMNAGKSTTLLQASHNYLERGMQTLLFTPSLDDRAGTGVIASRIGLSKNAIPVDTDFDFFHYISEQKEKIPNLKCVLIDESQFLTKDQVHQLSDVATFFGIPVLCYGIRSDFRGEPFEGSKYLLTIAEELIEIKTICDCGRKATMNMRIGPDGKAVKEGAQVHVGGNESYMAKCMKCYKEGMGHTKARTMCATA